MRTARQPASVSTWVVRIAAVAIVAVGVDWVLGQRKSDSSAPGAVNSTIDRSAAAPQALELIQTRSEASARNTENDTDAAAAPLAPRIRFASDSAAMIGDSDAVLDRVAAQLSLDDATMMVIRVLGRERSDQRGDRALKRERGRAVIAALVERGLPFARLAIDTDGNETSTLGTHRIAFAISRGDIDGG